MPWLSRLDKDGIVQQSWELGKEPLVFGRGDDAGVVIDDHEISRHHFEIKFVGDAHVLNDLHSTNGTWVNGRKVMHSYLKSEDKVRAGQTQFRYQVGTATLLGFVEQSAHTTFKHELHKIYDDAESKKH